MRKNHGRVGGSEGLVVPARTLPPMAVPFRQMAKLRTQYTRLDSVEPAVVPLDVVEVFPRLAVVAQHLAAPRQSLVVGRDGSRLAASTQILAGIEAERCGAAHRARLTPAFLLLREILRTVRLAGVLDDDQV